MNILAVGAHPDDIELGCAHILIKEAKKGNQIKLLLLSRGEAGTSGTPDGREQEAREAAGLIGSAIDFLDLGGDCRLEYRPEYGIRIAAEIRKSQPAIVLAPHTGENQHPDHVVAGRLTRDACRLARYGGLEALKPLPVHRIANLYFYNITQHLGPRPDLVIDVTDVMTEWEAVIRCHGSQVSAMRYAELQKAAARMLGLSIGTEYAAGFFINDPVRLENLSDITLSSRKF
jgi:LmbE family N-acetylglucosaminyl deacetylase